MEFKKAFELLKQGKKVKLPSWIGYWKWENNTIVMHCKDGSNIPITESEDIAYTLSNIISNDWECVDDDYEIKDLIHTFNFGEAIRNLKLGKKVARKGWNGKGMFLILEPGSIVPIENIKNTVEKEYFSSTDKQIVTVCPHIDMKAADGSLVIGWLASQTDMLADDWVIVDEVV